MKARKKAARPGVAGTHQSDIEALCDVHFAQATGKVIDSIRFTSESAGGSLVIDFNDQTALIIDYHPELRSTMEADFSDWKTGVAQRSKRWKRVSHWAE